MLRLMNPMIEIVGWTAALLILVGYGLLSTGRLAAGSRSYQLLNLVGALGFVINSGWNHALPSAGLNVIWMGISCYALWRPPQQR
jgi:hypothetical protein